MFSLPKQSVMDRLVVLGLGGLLAASLAGCKDPTDEGKRVPVTGKVTYPDGRPVPRGTVVFSPDASKGNSSKHEPRGEIDAEGNYRVMTAPKKDGVLPGWYKVMIISQEPIDEKNPYKPQPWLINPKYGNPATSGLEKEVVENPDPGRYDFKVSPAK